MRHSGEYFPDFTERAQVAYQRLSSVDKNKVDAVIDDIQRFGLRSRNILKLRGPHEIRLARVGNRLRILFQYEDGIFTILDIVPHDQLNRLIRLYRWD